MPWNHTKNKHIKLLNMKKDKLVYDHIGCLATAFTLGEHGKSLFASEWIDNYVLIELSTSEYQIN